MNELARGPILVSSIVNDITINLYIGSIGIDNYEIKYKFKINRTLELGLIGVTYYTKSIHCALLHCCSELYRHLSFISRRRVERMFHREMKKYIINTAIEKGKITNTEIKQYFKLNANYIKYLEVIAKIYELSIIILEYNKNDKNVIKIEFGANFICILKFNDIFVPVSINNEFIINNELIDTIEIFFIKVMIIKELELKDTEDLQSNKEILVRRERNKSYNPSKDDLLYKTDRNNLIIKALSGNTTENKKKEELNKREEELNKREAELNKQKEELENMIRILQVGHGEENNDD